MANDTDKENAQKPKPIAFSVEIEDSAGHVRMRDYHYNYDKHGQLVEKILGANGSYITRYCYDAGGRRTEQHEIQVNTCNGEESIIDSTFYSYDDQGREVEIRKVDFFDNDTYFFKLGSEGISGAHQEGTLPLTHQGRETVTRKEYDLEGRLVKITDGPYETHFDYDVFGRRIGESKYMTDPFNDDETKEMKKMWRKEFDYDGDGGVVEERESGPVRTCRTVLLRDSEGRVVRATRYTTGTDGTEVGFVTSRYFYDDTGKRVFQITKPLEGYAFPPTEGRDLPGLTGPDVRNVLVTEHDVEGNIEKVITRMGTRTKGRKEKKRLMTTTTQTTTYDKMLE